MREPVSRGKRLFAPELISSSVEEEQSRSLTKTALLCTAGQGLASPGRSQALSHHHNPPRRCRGVPRARELLSQQLCGCTRCHQPLHVALALLGTASTAAAIAQTYLPTCLQDKLFPKNNINHWGPCFELL